MKSQLRRITVENDVYVYSVKDTYEKETGATRIIVRIFLNGQKNTPLIIQFLTFCDTLHGHPLYVGVDMLNHATESMEHFNIHKPKYIKGFILEGIKNGWTGANRLDIQNGVNYMNRLGFDISNL